MLQVTVTIGRNVTTEGPEGPTHTPLDDRLWDEFRNQAATLVRSLAPAMTFHYDGVGEWEGVSEESRHYVALFETWTPVSLLDGSFGHELGNLARIFGQDAIAWSTGGSMLATPDQDVDDQGNALGNRFNRL